jgi:hypothetical protein
VKKILMAGAAISGAALCAWLVRAWLPELARVAARLRNSLSALRPTLPSHPPITGNPVPRSPDSSRAYSGSVPEGEAWTTTP